MRRKHVLSLLMASVGVALLIAATTVAAASSATRKAGGTLRVNQSAGTFDTLDPGLAYVANDWEVLHATQLLLVNFPDKAGQAGSQLVPEAARSFPTISNNGRTVTFHLREDLRLSDGSAVTAASYRRAWERVLSPKMYAQYGIFDQLDKMVVGAKAFCGQSCSFDGNPAAHISSSGVLEYPSAGPYYIAANRPAHVVVLKRNRYYHGSRPANPNEIVINSFPNSNGETSLLQIEKNQVDFDLAGVPSADVAAVAKNYRSQFHVGSESCTSWWALNSARPPTNNVSVRKALNYAIGRMSIINLQGPYAATPTDQLLEPGVSGYKKLDVYGNYPNFAKAEEVGGSALKNAAPLNILYYGGSAVRTNEAELIKSQLEHIGLTVNVIQASDFGPFGPDYSQDNLVRSGFCIDYSDPFDLINVFFGRAGNQFDGIPGSFYFRNSSLTRKVAHAASLTGRARARAYAALDRLLMVKYAPVVPLMIPNFRYLTSKRVHNIVFSHYLGYPVLNAMSVG
jgi:peptide/nickel transport system substrate-binding protein